MKPLSSLFGTEAEVVRDADFQILILANMIAPLGTAIVSPVLSTLTGVYGVSTASIGLMISALTGPSVVAIPLAGVLADRYGRKPILIAGLVLFGAAGTAVAFTTDFRVALGLRLVQGIGFAGLTPIIITSLGDLYEGTREATAQGFRFTGSGLTNTIFPIVSGGLVAVAWQYPFVLYAIALPIAAMVYLWFDEPSSVTEARPNPSSGAGRSQWGQLWQLLSQRRVQAFVIARGLPSLVWIGFMTYSSSFVVVVMGGTPFQTGVLVAIGSAFFAGGATQAGHITELFDSRFRPLVATNLALGGGLLAVAFAPTLAVAAVGISFVGCGFGISLSLYRSIITGLAPEHLRGGLVSVAESLGRLAGTLAPILMGGVIALATPAFGHAGAIQLAGLVVALIAGVGGVGCLVYVRRTPAAIPVEEFRSIDE